MVHQVRENPDMICLEIDFRYSSSEKQYYLIVN